MTLKSFVLSTYFSNHKFTCLCKVKTHSAGTGEDIYVKFPVSLGLICYEDLTDEEKEKIEELLDHIVVYWDYDPCEMAYTIVVE